MNLQDLSHLLDKVFLIFPNYCLGMSFSQFYQNYEFISFCTTSPISKAFCQFLSKYYLNVASANEEVITFSVEVVQCMLLVIENEDVVCYLN